MTPRAVVFDLWQTLARWPDEESRELRSRWSDSLGVSPERLDKIWFDPDFYRRRESGPIRALLEELCVVLGSSADVDEVLGWRLDLTRRSLVPVPGALETLGRLRRRGIATGLISNCTEEVALVWEQSPFAGALDVAVFSATAGCVKPERRIFGLACEKLGVAAADCLFVGDGANDELGGAARFGMTPVLVHPPDEAPVWDGLEGWDGLRITAIPQILELV